jgi:hypothetical protein
MEHINFELSTFNFNNTILDISTSKNGSDPIIFIKIISKIIKKFYDETYW